LETYGLDFLKVMNDHPYPHAQPITSVADLATLKVLEGTEDGFGQQLELIAALRRELDDRVYMVTTVFNTWSLLRLLVEPPEQHLPPVLDASVDAPSRWIREAYASAPEAVATALRTIGTSLAHFAARCLQAGPWRRPFRSGHGLQRPGRPCPVEKIGHLYHRWAVIVPCVVLGGADAIDG
jgi:hypothetical protein